MCGLRKILCPVSRSATKIFRACLSLVTTFKTALKSFSASSVLISFSKTGATPFEIVCVSRLLNSSPKTSLMSVLVLARPLFCSKKSIKSCAVFSSRTVSIIFSVLSKSVPMNSTIASMIRARLRRKISVWKPMPSGLRKSAVTPNQSAIPPIVAARNP